MKTQKNANAAAGDMSAANSEISPRFGDKATIANMVGVSRRTVDNFIRAGCPHLKIGSRRVRFDIAEVRDWLKQQFHVQRRAA